MVTNYRGIDTDLWERVKLMQYQYRVSTGERVTVMAMMEMLVERGIATLEAELSPELAVPETAE